MWPSITQLWGKDWTRSKHATLLLRPVWREGDKTGPWGEIGKILASSAMFGFISQRENICSPDNLHKKAPEFLNLSVPTHHSSQGCDQSCDDPQQIFQQKKSGILHLLSDTLESKESYVKLLYSLWKQSEHLYLQPILCVLISWGKMSLGHPLSPLGPLISYLGLGS